MNYHYFYLRLSKTSKLRQKVFIQLFIYLQKLTPASLEKNHGLYMKPKHEESPRVVSTFRRKYINPIFGSIFVISTHKKNCYASCVDTDESCAQIRSIRSPIDVRTLKNACHCMVEKINKSYSDLSNTIHFTWFLNDFIIIMFLFLRSQNSII